MEPSEFGLASRSPHSRAERGEQERLARFEFAPAHFHLLLRSFAPSGRSLAGKIWTKSLLLPCGQSSARSLTPFARGTTTGTFRTATAYCTAPPKPSLTPFAHGSLRSPFALAALIIEQRELGFDHFRFR